MWLAEIESGVPRQHYGNEHLQVFMAMPDGSSWVRLNAAACIREGQLMRHCVDKEPYLAEVAAGETILYSLRDANNLPHVTAEFDQLGLRFAQIKGQANSAPMKYRAAIIEFLNHKHRYERFDFSAQAICDLVSAGVLFDGRRFTLLENSNIARAAASYVGQVNW
jgi:hypothetical protein